MEHITDGENDSVINIMVIGVGYHARRIYVPFFINEQQDFNVKLVCGLDLLSQKNVIEEYLIGRKFSDMQMYYTEENTETDDLSDNFQKQLDDIILKYKIKGIIISTEPLAHTKYAKWALSRSLHILMDKPITSERDISTDIKKAKKILSDYNLLKEEYIKALAKNEGKLVFSLMAQRRFHPAYKLIRELILEVSEKTNCPVTSMQAFHSDGQWRLPTEIVEQDYHPYNQGYGKCSHSGYHTIDILSWFAEAGRKSEKKINNIDVCANFSRPLDFLTQLNLDDYRNLFHDFDSHNRYSQEEYNSLMEGFGEIDAFNTINFNHDNRIACLASLNLLHNGFGQRNWANAQGKDLYKGNGRIRQESHYVVQGPFQAISLISYQSQEVKPDNFDDIYDVGGEYHLDVHVFRNNTMFPEWTGYECYKINQLNINKMDGHSRGHQEDARRNGIVEFIENIQNFQPIEEHQSNYLDHENGTTILSGIYQSAIAKQEGNNSLVNLKYGKY